jgi:hypothetical protein
MERIRWRFGSRVGVTIADQEFKSHPALCCEVRVEAAERAYPGRTRIGGHCVQYTPIAQASDLSGKAAL